MLGWLDPAFFPKVFGPDGDLYLSSQFNDAILRYGVLHAEVSFLQKPYTAEQLAQCLARVNVEVATRSRR